MTQDQTSIGSIFGSSLSLKLFKIVSKQQMNAGRDHKRTDSQRISLLQDS